MHSILNHLNDIEVLLTSVKSELQLTPKQTQKDTYKKTFFYNINHIKTKKNLAKALGPMK